MKDGKVFVTIALVALVAWALSRARPATAKGVLLTATEAQKVGLVSASEAQQFPEGIVVDGVFYPGGRDQYEDEVKRAKDVETPPKTTSSLLPIPGGASFGKDFVASEKQLDDLIASGAIVGSPSYQAAVDVAYAQAAAAAEQTGGEVAWSSAGGYSAISQEEAYSYGW